MQDTELQVNVNSQWQVINVCERTVMYEAVTLVITTSDLNIVTLQQFLRQQI